MALNQLYRHFDKSGQLLYVGQSLNAIARLIQHYGSASWAAEIAFIEIELFGSSEALRDAEAKAISEEKPLHNIADPVLIAPAGKRRSRGRPPILSDRPWDKEGISRRTWYRKKNAKSQR